MIKAKDNIEKFVTIKLKDWQIPLALGAMRLGIWLEDWCAALVQTDINSYDTHSGRWILQVGSIIDQIKKQTGINKEDKEYGSSAVWLKEINRWVAKQCQINEKNIQRIEAGCFEENEASGELREEDEKSAKKPADYEFKIPDNIIKEAENWATRIQNEKK